MKRDEFQNLLLSVKQMKKIMRGEIKPSRTITYSAAQVERLRTPVEIKSIRAKMKLSQHEFAAMIGVSVDTLQNWEQGRRRPNGPARALLNVARQNPTAVLQALHGV